MVCNDLVMPVLLRLRRAAAERAPRPDRAAARHPARRHRADPAARLPVLQAGGRGLRAGLDRPDLVRRGGAVRAGDPRRDLLEGRHAPAARCAGLLAGFARLVLHAAAARAGALGLAADRPARARAVRHRAAQAAAAVRPRRPGPDHARDDLEHDREHRRLRRACRCRSRRAPTSTGRRACSSTCSGSRRGGRRALLARHGVGARSATTCWRGSSAPRAADSAFARVRARAGAGAGPTTRLVADAELVHYVEVQLAGAIGAASARIMVASVVKEEALTLDEVRDDPRRGVAGGRLQPPARAEVARAGGGDRRAARGQRAAEGARPAEGRLRLHGDPRAAHAAHLDPRVHRDPARRSRRGAGAAQEVPRHHHQGDRAPDAAHQPGARSRPRSSRARPSGSSPAST